jgi:hypothetical protein
MRIACRLAPLIGLLAAGCAATPPPHTGLQEPFDHYSPVHLNERAVAAVAAGDVTEAWILLERAARLAPHDQRIARNLAAVRAYRAAAWPEAREPAVQPPDETPAEGNAGTSVPAEPPPIWRLR